MLEDCCHVLTQFFLPWIKKCSVPSSCPPQLGFLKRIFRHTSDIRTAHLTSYTPLLKILEASGPDDETLLLSLLSGYFFLKKQQTFP